MLAAIYASTRAEELLQVPWSEDQKKQFTASQSSLQERHYATHYQYLERLVIERASVTSGGVIAATAVGRIYVQASATELRLLDIALLPSWRNQGIGTRLMTEVLRYADFLHSPVGLHVEPLNPAKRMYARMGFGVAETRGFYEYMVHSGSRTTRSRKNE